MIFNIVGLVIGLMILVAGIYYLAKERSDKESCKIYGITTGFGIVITLFFIIKILIEVI